MATTTLWAGKQLSGQEEVRLRRLTHALRRRGQHELAADFERFLPERESDWTPDEVASGAQVGPAIAFGAGMPRSDEDERWSA